MPNLLAPVGRQRAITDLGLVAPGALLHTYVSGTPNTNLATTSDAAGAVPNANPLVASAGGLFGPIYLPPGVAYHFVLTDAGGLPIWDQDPVTAGADPNAVAGNLSVSGLLTVTGFGLSLFQSTGPGTTGIAVQNTSPGPAASARVSVGNDTTFNLLNLEAYSSTFTPSAFAVPNGAGVLSIAAGGLSLGALHAAGVLRTFAGGAERGRVLATGEWLINQTGPVGGGMLGIGMDGTGHVGLAVQNLNPANTGTFVTFVNSATGTAGSIGHSGATSVVYGTSSDARLKDDARPATDLTALRALAVYDFRWTADGTRDRGVFAQEAAALFPRAILAGTDETTDRGDLVRPWMTDYSKFVPDLIVGWQAHDAAIAELRAAVAALAGKRR